MTPESVLEIANQAIATLLWITAPIMAVALISGLLIALFQALTSVQEMTLTFVPKILAVLLALLVFAHWILEQIMDFTIHLIEQIPYYIR